MTTDVAAICAGLTKAQRYALAWKGTNVGCIASNAQLSDRLIGKGLAVKTGGYNSGLMLDWTPLGLAVRAALQQNDEGEAS
jgi:hypothetical protein